MVCKPKHQYPFILSEPQKILPKPKSGDEVSKQAPSTPDEKPKKGRTTKGNNI